jgi:hypothetical protein
MHEITKTDPYSGEQFIPKRTNQIFANPENKSKFNNAKAKYYRDELNRINNALMKNFKVLNDLMKDQESITISYTELLKKGFDFTFFTHFTVEKESQYPTIYYFMMVKTKDQKGMYTIINIKR